MIAKTGGMPAALRPPCPQHGGFQATGRVSNTAEIPQCPVGQGCLGGSVVAWILGAAGPGSVSSARCGLWGSNSTFILSLQAGERRRQCFSPAQGRGGPGGCQGSGGWRAGSPLPSGDRQQEGWPVGRHPPRSLPPWPQARSSVNWLASQEEAILNSSCALRAQDKGTATHGGDCALPGSRDTKALFPPP